MCTIVRACVRACVCVWGGGGARPIQINSELLNAVFDRPKFRLPGYTETESMGTKRSHQFSALQTVIQFYTGPRISKKD